MSTRGHRRGRSAVFGLGILGLLVGSLALVENPRRWPKAAAPEHRPEKRPEPTTEPPPAPTDHADPEETGPVLFADEPWLTNVDLIELLTRYGESIADDIYSACRSNAAPHLSLRQILQATKALIRLHETSPEKGHVAGSGDTVYVTFDDRESSIRGWINVTPQEHVVGLRIDPAHVIVKLHLYDPTRGPEHRVPRAEYLSTAPDAWRLGEPIVLRPRGVEIHEDASAENEWRRVSHSIESHYLGATQWSPEDCSCTSQYRMTFSPDEEISGEEAFLQALRMGHTDFSSMRLLGLNFGPFAKEFAAARAKFGPLSFHAADLRGTNFRGCNLRGATFVHARTSGARFTLADLRGAKLDSAGEYIGAKP